ncbi:MAG: calcium-translocating P-type ATPase, SERCA-type [Methanobacteriota archaeon]|nr:MAG: calcium-translocating P-type ATPase, SERCA-type [Euryarchaeota archaeon]
MDSSISELPNLPYYTLPKEEVLKKLQTSENGLNDEQVQERLNLFGENKLIAKKKKGIFSLFLDQFKDILVIILLIAAFVTGFFLHELAESILIIIILILNAILGVYQEWKADKAIEALSQMLSHRTRVIRDGHELEIDSKLLVPGDIVLLKQGDRVPADCRVLAVNNLKVDESQLTGESHEVHKSSYSVLEEDAPIGDRVNMLYMGTYITFGKGMAVVTATGMKTEMGKLALEVDEIDEEPTPTQVKLDEFGKKLGLAIIALMVFMTAYGIFVTRLDFLIMIETSVSLAVAAIPEGLPIVITLALALGVQKMARQNAIVKKLPSVESLGSVTFICTDKTGTLTMNRMTVQEVIILRNSSALTVAPNEIREHKTKDMPPNEFHMLRAAALCNNAIIDGENELGDPTELALLRLCNEYGFHKADLEKEYRRIDEIPFDSERKRMTVMVEAINDPEDKIAYIKGAPEVLLNMAKMVDLGNGPQPLTEEIKEKIQYQIDSLADKALRVLGFGYYALRSTSYNIYDFESRIVISGFMGMIDPPKEGVKEAVSACHTAGIKVMMVTGDHKKTAVAIGKEIGIVTDEKNVLTGQELDNLNDAELAAIIRDIEGFARISPQHKLRIVRALKDLDEIVAMTGDGVNDAPALKGADIGVAMGSGTDVTKETADMILEDDNFTTIVKAVEEGRGIYDNMTKFIRYMLASNLAEIVVIFLSIILNLPIPFVATQILWINLVTDGVPALALGNDPPSRGIMKRPPRNPKESLISAERINHILLFGGFISLVTLGSYILFLETNMFGTKGNHAVASSIAFAIMSYTQFAHAMNVREDTASIIGKNFFKNRALVITVVISIFLQFLVVQGDQFLEDILGSKILFEFFGTVPLTGFQWLWIATMSIMLVVWAEFLKLIKRNTRFKSIC